MQLHDAMLPHGQLSESMRVLEAQNEWLRLKESERRPGDPPVLAMDAELAWSIWDEQSRFMSIAAEFHDTLNQAAEKAMPCPEIEYYRQELLKFEARFQFLTIPKRL